MSDLKDRIAQLSPKRLALLALELEERLAAAEGRGREPVAVVGMACRFPGASTPDEYWKLLVGGVDAISEVPRDRWDVDRLYDPDPDAAGKMASRWGGFLDDIQHFDPSLFGISQREANSMDPQQRLLLEVAWEALERAGQAPDRLAATATGVFVGICNNDYAQLLSARDLTRIDAYLASGNAFSVASGRLSYVLGLQGPSLSIDTGCSSSLVALHLACQSLRMGECRLALAGGTNVICSPRTTITMSRSHMMAPDGRCKTFDASADGFVRGEGCGVVLLKRLADARADGDTVLAVVRGTAANQDGRSSGLTAPNGPSQEAVIRAALANASVSPDEVSYVEAHGTGTSLGDPIEARALGVVYGKGRPADHPLLVGSVKTNFGHLEAAAGIAGFMKVVLALQHRHIPRQLHLKSRSPYIDWDQLAIAPATSETEWPGTGARIAGVSSFGFSGTNVHVIVEEAAAPPPAVNPIERPLHVCCLSARSEPALREQAGRLADHLGASPDAMADVCFTQNTGRARLAHRVAVLASAPGTLRDDLERFARGESSPRVRTDRPVGPDQPGVAFLFTGQGAQYAGMGRRLYETEPTFRRLLDRTDEILRPALGCSVLEIMRGGPGDDRLDQTVYTQPALFAIEYALASLWQSWGVKPSLVMGHSLGEFPAACVAGVFSLEDGLRLTSERARLTAGLPPGGAMAALQTDERSALEAIARFGGAVSIAAINGAENSVVSGPAALVDALVTEFAGRGLKTQRLSVSNAFHSPLVDAVLDEFESVARRVTFSRPRIDLVSNVTGGLVTDEVCDPSYWRRHLRQAVRFADGMQAAYGQGYRVFVEVGPHPVLLGMGRTIVGENAPAAWLPSLRRSRDEWEQMLETLGDLFVRGAAVDFAGFDSGYQRRRVSLPTYPFERQRCWFDLGEHARRGTDRQVAGVEAGAHPLLDTRLDTARGEVVFQTALGTAAHPFLLDHEVYGMRVVPAPVLVEMMHAAGLQALGSRAGTVDGLTIHDALVLPDEGECELQVSVVRDAGPGASVAIYCARAEPSGTRSWRQIASGRVSGADADAPLRDEDLAALQGRCPDEASSAQHYETLLTAGVEFGASFRGLDAIWRGPGEALARLRVPETIAGDTGYAVHPATLDACLQVLGVSLLPATQAGDEHTYLMVGFDRYRVTGRASGDLWAHACVRSGGDLRGETVTGDVRLLDGGGRVIAAVEGVQLKRAPRDALRRHRHVKVDEWLYEIQWRDDEVAHATPAASVLPKVSDAVQRDLGALADKYQLDQHERLIAELESLSYAALTRTLTVLGWSSLPGDHLSLDAVAGSLHVASRHRRLLARVLGMLAEEGVLDARDGGWTVVRPLPDIDPAPLAQAIRATFPQFDGELALLSRCVEQLPGVLRGEVDPVQVLFPDGSMDEVEALTRRSPAARAYNTLVARAVEAVVAGHGRGPIRVVEVGAGTGGTTASVLPLLPPERSRYSFTDVSPLFLSRAAQKFADHRFVDYRLLDIEADPCGQGLEAHKADLVIAANVVHATGDLRATLANVRRLLAPGGMLLLLEGTEPLRWVDLTFGLTDGWWKFRDLDLRPSHPLLPRPAWPSLLSSVGFEAVDVLPDDERAQGRYRRQVLVVARAAAAEAHAGNGGQPRQTWVVVGNGGGLGDGLAQAIAARGDRVVTVRADGGPADRAIDPSVPADCIQLLASVRDEGAPPVAHVVHLGEPVASREDATSVEALDQDVTRECQTALHLTQALAAGDVEPKPRLWIVTRDAQPAGRGRTLSLAQSALWGLARTIAAEHPEIWGGAIDLGLPSASDVPILLGQIGDRGDDQVAFEDGRRRVARLTRLHRPRASRSLALRADATYLVTGGTGGIGLTVARWMVEKGARHVVLVGRTGPQRARPEALQSLLDAGGPGIVVRCADVTRADDVAAVLAEIEQTMPPLAGVMHVAGIFDDRVLSRLDWARFARVLAPKVRGAWLLHALTERMRLDFFVLFSSGASFLGPVGLGNYAAGNAFLDALAHHRRSLGLPALSIDWGPWDRVGMADAVGERRESQWSEGGLERMAADHALEALEQLIVEAPPQVAVLNVDWSAYLRTLGAAAPRLYGELAREASHSATRARAAAPVSPLARIEQGLPGERRELLLDHVRSEVATVLGFDGAENVDPQRGLFDLGMDSLTAVELKNRLQLTFGRPLPSTLLFDHASVEDLTTYLGTHVLQWTSGDPGRETAAAAAPASGEVDARSEDELAELLSQTLERLS